MTIVVSLLVLAAACSQDTEPTTVPAPPTTIPAPTTNPPPSSTTTLPPQVTVTGETFRGDLREQIAAVYSVAMGMPADLRADEALVRHIGSAGLSAADRQVAVDFAATTVKERRVGVVVAGEDTILASRGVDEDDWSIIGAHLPSLGLDPWFGAEPHQIFVIGSDARTGEDPLKLRADSLHIISLTPDGADLSIVGIPRDSWIPAPYGGSTKITNIMGGRGPEVVTEAAENETGLDFDGYIVTAFAGFVRLVNDLGGMTVEIPFAMNEPKSDAFFSAGVQEIDGNQALAFARNRTLAGGDFTRSFHQGVIMQWGLLALQDQGPLAIPLFLDALDKHTYTDLTPEQLMLITAAALSNEAPLETANLVVPASIGNVGAASVVFLGDGAAAIFADLEDRVLDEVPE